MKSLIAWMLCSTLAAVLAMGCAGVNKNQNVPVQPTVFKLVGKKTTKLESGDYLTSIRLAPVGRANIPLVYVDAETRNGAIIKSLSISVQGSAMASSSGVGTHSSLEAKDFHPQKISIQMITDKNPADFQMGIKPFVASK